MIISLHMSSLWQSWDFPPTMQHQHVSFCSLMALSNMQLLHKRITLFFPSDAVVLIRLRLSYIFRPKHSGHNSLSTLCQTRTSGRQPRKHDRKATGVSSITFGPSEVLFCDRQGLDQALGPSICLVSMGKLNSIIDSRDQIDLAFSLSAPCPAGRHVSGSRPEYLATSGSPSH